MLKKFLIGCYTKHHVGGIHQIIFDTQALKIINDQLIIQANNPTYLSLLQDDIVYFINQNSNKSLSGLSVYNFKSQSLSQNFFEPGTTPAHIFLDQTNRYLYESNYHMGTVKVFKLNEKGLLTITDKLFFGNKSHPHYTGLTPDKKIIINDLGLNKTLIFQNKNGKLIKLSEIKFTTTIGPRHLIFHPTKNICYILGELGNKLITLKYHNKINNLEIMNIKSTIDQNWTKYNGAAAIRIDCTGNFLYVSNRGMDNINVYRIEKNGIPHIIQKVKGKGKFPRDIFLDSTESFLLSANQNSNNINIFQRNPLNGKLKFLLSHNLPEAVCIKEIKE